MDYKHEDGTAVMLKYGRDHQKWYQTLCSRSNLCRIPLQCYKAAVTLRSDWL